MAAKIPERFAKPRAVLHGDAAADQWRRVVSRGRPARLARDAATPSKANWPSVTAGVALIRKRFQR
jgi:hypothetical protein